MQQPKYWFPAKRYGWGWGPPNTWQGWVVLPLFFALFIAGKRLLLPQRNVAAVVLYAVLLSIGLIIVCYLKGEPPRWRWGGKS